MEFKKKGESKMAMTEEAKAARRAYARAWARSNPDKVKAQQERYWKKKADQMKAEREARAKDER